jgi:hypothetical protein
MLTTTLTSLPLQVVDAVVMEALGRMDDEQRKRASRLAAQLAAAEAATAHEAAAAAEAQQRELTTIRGRATYILRELQPPVVGAALVAEVRRALLASFALHAAGGRWMQGARICLSGQHLTGSAWERSIGCGGVGKRLHSMTSRQTDAASLQVKAELCSKSGSDAEALWEAAKATAAEAAQAEAEAALAAQREAYEASVAEAEVGLASTHWLNL